MASEASSGLLMFIIALSVAALAGGAMATVVGKMSTELRERGDTFVHAMGADLSIVNDPQNVPYDGANNNLTLYVKNTGSARLYAVELLVMVNGIHAEFNWSLLDGASQWSEGTVMALYVDATLSAGDHTARVVHTPSIADSLDFRL